MKKLNFIVGVLVAAALLLLVVMLVMSFFTETKTDAPVKTSEPPKATATMTPPTTDDAADTPEPTDDVSPTPDIAPLEGETIRLEAFIGHEKLTITYSAELFSRLSPETGELFYLKADSTNETFIEIIFREGELEFYKASFLDGYIPQNTTETLGQIFIADSGVTSEGISKKSGDYTAEAWLIEVEGGFFAVVAGYHDDYQDNAARATLYKMLDTLEFSL